MVNIFIVVAVCVEIHQKTNKFKKWVQINFYGEDALLLVMNIIYIDSLC